MPVACNLCVFSCGWAVLKYQGKVFSSWSGARKFPLFIAFFSHSITRASFGFVVGGSVGWLGCRGHPRRFGWLLLWLPDGRGRKSTASVRCRNAIPVHRAQWVDAHPTLCRAGENPLTWSEGSCKHQLWQRRWVGCISRVVPGLTGLFFSQIRG